MVKQFFILSAKRFIMCLLMSVLLLADISAQGYQSRNQNAYPSRYRQSSTQNQRPQDAYFSRYRQSSSQYQRNGSTRREYSNPFMKQDQNNNSSKTEKTSKRSAKSEENAKQISSSISDNKSADDVELIVTGEGRTKDDATKTALRSAIEQAFGTFVSSNTKILNDDLVKDEIVTVSSGNIKSYKYVSENHINGKWNITVQAIVSVGKLISYVQQKGGETELAGATFAMDVKMKKLYKQNEEMALKNLIIQLNEIVPKMFDYSIEVESPKASGGKYACKTEVTITTNANYTNARELIWNTLSALCIKKKEDVADFKEKGITPTDVQFFTYGKEPRYNGLTRIVMTQLPVTYMERPWSQFKDKYVFFRSNLFFKDFGKLISEVLNGFVIDFGFEKATCSYDGYIIKDEGGRCFFGGNTDMRDNPYLYEMPTTPRDWTVSIGYAQSSHGNCFFPVEKSAKWKLSGVIYFTENELEKVNTIKVNSRY